MTNFINLHMNGNGDIVSVRPDCIAAVSDAKGGGCLIWLTGGFADGSAFPVWMKRQHVVQLIEEFTTDH